VASISMTVNGVEHTVDVGAGMPLLWVLRDVLQLTGTKYGCGEGICGACTVLLDGRVTRSCVTPVSAAAGGEVLTIEGLSEDATHSLQQAWIEEDVGECGYCQPGQIMTALSLLARNPHPTNGEIDQAMSGNFCRCGTYNRIRRAIHRAAAGSV
jgi:isoquinoline 1-oxidoreductase alpha subunit